MCPKCRCLLNVDITTHEDAETMLFCSGCGHAAAEVEFAEVTDIEEHPEPKPWLLGRFFKRFRS